MTLAESEYSEAHGYGYFDKIEQVSYLNMSKRFDWGRIVSAGLEVKNWVMNLAYDVSLSKQYRWDNVGVYYQTFTLSFGYKFRL